MKSKVLFIISLIFLSIVLVAGTSFLSILLNSKSVVYGKALIIAVGCAVVWLVSHAKIEFSTKLRGNADED